MWVKTTAGLLALAFALAGCAARHETVPDDLRVLELSRSYPGRFVSLLPTAGGLLAVFSSGESLSLAATPIPLTGAGMPLAAPPAGIVDKIDAAPTLAPDFGEHVASVISGTAHILYVDRKKEEKPILKWLWSQGDGGWNVDTLEQGGLPIAVIPGENGAPVAFWATDSLLARGSADDAAREVLSPFSAAGPGSVSGNGFTVYDRLSGKLLFFTFVGDKIEMSEIPGGRPLHSSTLSPSGLLAVATYVPETGRILLLERSAQSGKIRESLVTISESTQCLALCTHGTGYVFCYDGVEHLGNGAAKRTLSILVPDGSRYRRFLLLKTDSPILGVSLVVEGAFAYVLVAQENVTLLQAKIP